MTHPVETGRHGVDIGDEKDKVQLDTGFAPWLEGGSSHRLEIGRVTLNILDFLLLDNHIRRLGSHSFEFGISQASDGFILLDHRG